MPEIKKWDDISGWFSAGEANALREIACRVAREGVVAFEVGSWKGRSTAVLADTVRACGGKLFCVDHWRGSEGYPTEQAEALEKEIFYEFKGNMQALGLWDTVVPLMVDSLTAAGMLREKSADMVFLDAGHHYKEIAADIRAWLPIVRPGGIICGHDCEGRATDPGIAKLLAHSNDDTDFIVEDNVGCHPGVVRAVTEAFGDKHELTTYIWWWRVTA